MKNFNDGHSYTWTKISPLKSTRHGQGLSAPNQSLYSAIYSVSGCFGDQPLRLSCDNRRRARLFFRPKCDGGHRLLFQSLVYIALVRLRVMLRVRNESVGGNDCPSL